MPMFQNSQNIDASGGIFNDVGRDQHNIGTQIIYNANNPSAIQVTLSFRYCTLNVLCYLTSDILALSLNPVPDAVFDSINAVSGCLAGTRQEVIGQIVGWIDGNGDQPMCWLHGAAGCGKSVSHFCHLGSTASVSWLN